MPKRNETNKERVEILEVIAKRHRKELDRLAKLTDDLFVRIFSHESRYFNVLTKADAHTIARSLVGRDMTDEEIAKAQENFSKALQDTSVWHLLGASIRSALQAEAPKVTPEAKSSYTERELLTAARRERILPLVKYVLERLKERRVDVFTGAWVPVWNEVEISDVLRERGVVDEAIESFLVTLRGLLAREDE
jgi:hypothetical protein